MDITAIILLLATKFPIVTLIAAALGALVVFGQALVVLTPTQADDQVLTGLEANPYVGPILRALKAFAPIQKKPPTA